MADRLRSFYTLGGRVYGPADTDVPEELLVKQEYHDAKRLDPRIGTFKSYRERRQASADPSTEDESPSEPNAPEGEDAIPSDFPFAALLAKSGVKTFSALEAIEGHESVKGIGEERWEDIQAALEERA